MRVLNAANLLTFLRLLATGPVLWAILERRFRLALGVLLLAGVSDPGWPLGAPMRLDDAAGSVPGSGC